jgi:NAD-dependent deacetylase
MNGKEAIKRFAKILRESKSIFVVTGAGLSAESGLPTYRGIGGLYNDRETDDGMPIEKALSGPVFRSRPEVTWKYLAEIEAGARGATFNRGHEILAEMESYFDSVWILTQNVDGFHSSSGSTNVIEIHGNLHRMKCTECDYKDTHEDYAGFELPPRCPDCNGLVRPDVVLFEEMLPASELERLHGCASMPFDTVISIGTSSNFPYIVQPVLAASQLGIATVEINPDETDLSVVVDLHLKMGAVEALEGAWGLLMGNHERQ